MSSATAHSLRLMGIGALDVLRDMLASGATLADDRSSVSLASHAKLDNKVSLLSLKNSWPFIRSTTGQEKFSLRNCPLRPLPLATSNADETDDPGWLAHEPTATKTYDFIIVGAGTAGTAAMQRLRATCPSASVAVVEPLRPCHRHGVDGWQLWATGLDPVQRHLQVCDHYTGVEQVLAYRHGILLATGARAAPPPHYLMDDAARPQILELRATVVPDQEQSRPILSPEQTRHAILTAAARGQRITILGSGWEALDLAIEAGNIGSKSSQQRPVLVFGNAGPLSYTLPSYLSLAVSKRLRSKRIAVEDRTLVRYISHDAGTQTADSDTSRGKLQLYTCRSFDFMDSNMQVLDWIVVAPETSGARGSATLATAEVPEHLEETANGRSWYQTWSMVAMESASDHPSIACYKDDGRLAVNAELAVATGVYAAGSAAKYANGLSGHACPAGAGMEEGAQAGALAAENMSREYRAASRLFRSGPEPVRFMDPIPVFRSDKLAYSGGQRSSLLSMGINALCVGNCDSERFATHGLWWTNLAAQRRLMRMVDDDGKALRRRKTLHEANRPVYGLGVVYYLDRTGKIQGVMTWGLPFTVPDQRRSDNRPLNLELVEQLKDIVRYNGGLGSLENEMDQMRMSDYLTQQSRHLVALSFAGYAGENETKVSRLHQLDGALENFPRPLHRFTDVRPPNVRSVGVLKRRDGHGHGVLGEDLFARYQEAVADAPVAKPSDQNVGTAERQAQTLYEWNVWEQKNKRWEENEQRARPGKEDLLWLRKGDEMRNTSARETMIQAYNSVIWSGSSS